LEDAKSENWHSVAVVKCDCWYVCHHCLLYSYYAVTVLV